MANASDSLERLVRMMPLEHLDQLADAIEKGKRLHYSIIEIEIKADDIKEFRVVERIPSRRPKNGGMSETPESSENHVAVIGPGA